MTDAPALTRFCVYAARDDGSHGHVVEAASFAEAALQFVEVWHPAPDEADRVTLIVCDQDSGEQQCFVVALTEREAEPCG